ncbi:MAG: F0F1 ATP synthase subunit A [bacterium]
MHGFSWATLIFGPGPHWNSPWYQEIMGIVKPALTLDPLFHAVVTALILLAIILVIRSRARSQADDILPEGRLTLLNVFELGLEWLLGMMEDIIGPHYKKYTPLIAGTFFYILVANLLGLVPYFAPATDKWSITISMAIVVFFATHIYGIQAHGMGYFKHFISPVWPPSPILWVLSIIYLPIEVISHLARVLSLSLRLMANMTADHTVLTIFLMLSPMLIPAIFYGLGVLICLIQAFIFTALTIVYFSMAVAHEEGEEH